MDPDVCGMLAVESQKAEAQQEIPSDVTVTGTIAGNSSQDMLSDDLIMLPGF